LPAGNPSPSANGVNGGKAEAAQPATPGDRGAAAHPTPRTSTAGRGPDGRFDKGNAGGTGNPFARQVAALRQAALAAITPDAIRAILAKMAELALAGDVQAAKLVLAYAVGKPAAAPDPDRLDVEEWHHFKNTAPMMSEVENLLMPEPSVPLECVRLGREARTRDYSAILATALQTPEQELPSLLDLLGKGRRPQRGDPGDRPRHKNAVCEAD
jgi:hypothetical protein